MNIKKLSLRQKMKKAGTNSDKWFYIIYHYDIPESLLREFKDQINWELVVQWKQLSKDFLREIFSSENDNNQLINLSAFQYTDQKFIEQRKDKIRWSMIAFDRTNFSQQFLLKWSQKINWEHIWNIKRKWSKQFWEYLKKKIKMQKNDKNSL